MAGGELIVGVVEMFEHIAKADLLCEGQRPTRENEGS